MLGLDDGAQARKECMALTQMPDAGVLPVMKQRYPDHSPVARASRSIRMMAAPGRCERQGAVHRPANAGADDEHRFGSGVLILFSIDLPSGNSEWCD